MRVGLGNQRSKANINHMAFELALFRGHFCELLAVFSFKHLHALIKASERIVEVVFGFHSQIEMLYICYYL